MIEIKSHGLHWKNDDRNKFTGLSKKKGIYVLEYNFIVIYIGKAENSIINRLKKHNNNHHQGRWNMFSWFEVDFGNNKQIFKENLAIVESLCIAMMEPKLNGQIKTHRLGERIYQSKIK